VTAVRVLAVISALFVVLAFALAIMLPPEMPLIQAIAVIDHGWLVSFQDMVREHVSEWVWVNMAVPVLLRPVWLMPTALALVAAGAAMTLSSRGGPARSRRRS
jgi:hypothetical protein